MGRSVLRAAVIAAAVVWATRAEAVPSYVRQTGFSCNQCHVSWAPAPDFTMTGMKFRMNGYRDPFTADKIEAGQEGAINGKRLVLGLQNAWTFHYRSSLLQQSKAPSDPLQPAPNVSSISTNQFSSVGFDYAGPIGEHFGIWTEYYVDAAGSVGNVRGDMTNAEYTVAFATNPGGPGNIFGIVWTNQEVPNDMGFSPIRSGAPSSWFANLPRSGRILPNSRLAAYVFLADRLAFNVGIMAGEDNTDYKTLAWGGLVGYAIKNTDDFMLWVSMPWKLGADLMPLVSNKVFVNSAPARYDYVDQVTGVSAFRSANAPYGSANMGDGLRIDPEIRLGITDRGPHSILAVASYAYERDTYDDGSKAVNQGWGVTARYYWERTLGLNVTFSQRTKWEFTDRFGVVHPAKSALNWSFGPTYRVAMNAALELTFNRTQALVLDRQFRTGYAWNLSWHFLF